MRGRVHYHEEGQGRAEILIDVDGILGNRVDPPYSAVDVELEDGRITPPTWNEDRLVFVSAPRDPLRAATFDDERDAYEAQLRALLRTQLGATEVVVFDHTLRAEDGGFRPPSYHVHCDYNAWSARTRLQALLGRETAAGWSEGHFAVVNVWRPLGGPVVRAPIGFVRPCSVDPSDWLDVDIVFPDRRGQVRGLRHDPAHRWVYLPRMDLDEAAVFATYVSEGIDGIAHAAVELDSIPANAPPRHSIESRAFVRWGTR